jgi:hypothetical protein
VVSAGQDDPARSERSRRIAISLAGEGGGTLYYDSLRLERSGGNVRQKPEALVEPTVLFRRTGEQVKEATEEVICHHRPSADGAVSLRIGTASAVTNGVEEHLSPLPPGGGGIDILLKSRRFSTIRTMFDTGSPPRPLAQKETH